MKLPTLLIAGAVTVTGLFAASSAQADDHRSHHRYYHNNRAYYGSQPYYYRSRPAVVYDEPYFADRAYGGPSVSVAFGGRDHWRHSHHDYHHHRR